ncbi:sensor histidine kinase [Actinomyces slackii]|uniref:Sensor histidine kinase desK n=1 Tax=Actinomyces slackii TaxID=52774 RepID=A0A3S4SLL0_9ACTO|nr:sensor histidine kinase [Actinomyces slackii]VEG75622.1 Sensor histidine kinase desK [Actinomyces slackii]
MSASPAQAALPASWSDWRRTWPGTAGWLGVDVQSSIWVGFLIPAIAFLLRSPAPAWAKALGTVGMTAFGVIYVIEISLIAKRVDFTRVPTQSTLRQEMTPALRPLVLLAICAGTAIIAITWYFPLFLPYFCAVLLFTMRLRTGLMACACLCVTSLLIALPATALDPQFLYFTLGCLLSSGFVVISRFYAEQEEQRAHRAREQAAMAEREEISRDVHDLLGHSLTVLTLKAEVAQRLLRQDPQAAERELAEVIELSRAALADVRATVTRLRTPDLASQVESSRTAFAAAQIDAEISGAAGDVPLGQRELISWALREATTNILRHAAATRVRVAIAAGRLHVVDNGRGLAGAPAGNGLRGLRRRVEAAGGRLRVVSPAPSGPGMGGQEGPGTEMEVVL